MINYKDMTKEEILGLLRTEIQKKKNILLEEVKRCLNVSNRTDLGFDALSWIYDSLAEATHKTEDGEEAIRAVRDVTDGVWLPDDDKDVEPFVDATVTIHELRGLEQLVGYLS